MTILDTDTVTFLQRRGSLISEALRSHLTALSADEQVVTTIISYEEQTRGWIALFAEAKGPEAIVSAYQRLLTHFENYKKIQILPYTNAAELKFKELRALKIRIGTRDLRIASIALSLGATLLTRNISDFARVPGLQAVDWTKL